MRQLHCIYCYEWFEPAKFGFGSPVQCTECGTWLETDWDYLSYDSLAQWITGINKMNKPEKDSEHGIQLACYSNGEGGFRPMFECLCGWTCREANWEEAGAEFDWHLEKYDK